MTRSFSSVLAQSALFLSASAPAFALWPLPTSYSPGSSALILSSNFSITLSGIDSPADDLTAAISRTSNYLQTDALERLVVGRGSADASAIATAGTISALVLQYTGSNASSITAESQVLVEDRDEAYTLTLPDDGSAATISANSTLGLFRGLTTFEQFWYTYQDTVYTIEAPVEIEDAPVYPYRGFMLDTARNYFSVDDIKRTLDAMSWVKMTTFHWHIVDSQSFPLQVDGYMEISAAGAYDNSSIYSPDDVADVVSYAGAIGIDVMVEIDTPGHTSIIHLSHPDYVACPEFTPWATYANEPPAGQLRFTDAATQNFTAGLLTATANMFPSPYFSTGGDEINQACYDWDDVTQQDLNSTGLTFTEALSDFTSINHQALMDLGKTPVVWEEMVLDYNVTSLDPSTVVFVWISSDNAISVAKAGYKLVHAPSDYFYLDCGHGGWVGDYPDGASWCDPFKTWQYAYSFDPIANMTIEEAALVLGGQQLLWTEQSGPQSLDDTVWPRAAASAELFWSGPGGNVTSALPRLHALSFRMNQRGVKSIPLQPLWCALRDNACDLTA